MSSWEIMLSKGQQWDWLGDVFWRVQTLVVLFVVGLGFLIFRETADHATRWSISVRWRERNFARRAASSSFAPTVCLRRQHVAAGPCCSRCLATMLTTRGWFCRLPEFSRSSCCSIVGMLLGRGVDARWLIAGGLLVLGIGNFWMSLYESEISPWEVVWPRVVLIVGLSMIFAPINVAAYLYMPRHMRARRSGCSPLAQRRGERRHVRGPNDPGAPRDIFMSCGSASISIRSTRRCRVRPPVAGRFVRLTGDPAAAKRMSLQVLDNLRLQQASSLAYFDVFWVTGVISFALVFLVLLMKRSVAEKGAHVGAE